MFAMKDDTTRGICIAEKGTQVDYIALRNDVRVRHDGGSGSGV